MKKEKKNQIPENNIEQNTAPELTPEEIKLLGARLKQTGEDRSKLPPFDNGEKAKAVRYAKKNVIVTVSAIVLAAAMLTAFILLAVFIYKESSGGINKSDYTFVFGKTKYTEKYKDTVINGILYIDMNRIAAYTGMTMSGSAEKIKYTASDSMYLKFENNSEYAVINGSLVSMSSFAHISSEKCLVPYKFFAQAVDGGLEMKLDTKNNTVTFSRPLTDEKDETSFQPLNFTASDFKVIQTIVKPAGKPDDYNIDMNGYEQYIDPADASQYLQLVNKQNPIGSVTPTDLVQLTCRVNPGHEPEYYQLRNCAAQALYAMMDAMEADGITDIYVTSTYRSYERQQELYTGYVNQYLAQGMSREEAEAKASRTSAKPGESEHQTGLCLDFSTSTSSFVQENSAAYEWLSKNAYKYGFILRYPKDKVNITQYDYEPWHYRFVGRTAATEIALSGLCLEEYLNLK